jgi:DNA processing protein
MEGKIYLAALAAFRKFGPRRLEKLRNFFPNWESAFNSSFSELRAAGIEEIIAEEFLVERKKINPTELEKNLRDEEIKIISFSDLEYPKNLKQISDPPALLYLRGELRLNLPLLAIVGARKNTPYGERAINSLIPPLVTKNIGIVSGLALGTDALAHEKTLNCGGYTIAVLGTGIDRKTVYPFSNQNLSERIISAGGALISEFPPKTAPLRQNFPLRNRIITGLAQGVLVVEAGLKSGSLITAQIALDENREILAVPGNIFSSQSIGTNNLIKQGAKTVLTADDILEIFGLAEESLPAKTSQDKLPFNNTPTGKTAFASADWSGLSPEERTILLNLSSEPTNADELKDSAKLDIRIINSTLSILEIKGLVRNIGGNYIIC